MSQTWIPADRFLAVVDKDGKAYVGKQSPTGRRLSELRSGRQKFVSLDWADKVLIGMGLDYYWHVSKEDGGLADIYEDGAQYGQPGYNQENLIPGGPKRLTDEERREANRRKYLRRKQRRLEEAA